MLVAFFYIKTNKCSHKFFEMTVFRTDKTQKETIIYENIDEQIAKHSIKSSRAKETDKAIN